MKQNTTSPWIKRYRQEQDSICMPEQCREAIITKALSGQAGTTTPDTSTQHSEVIMLQQTSRFQKLRPLMPRMAAALCAITLAGGGIWYFLGSKHSAEVMQQPEASSENASIAYVPSEAAPQAETEQRQPETTQPADEAKPMDQDTLYYRCRTSIQFLDRISGSVEIYTPYFDYGAERQVGGWTRGSFSLDFGKEQYFSEFRDYDMNDTFRDQIQEFNDNGHYLRLHDMSESTEPQYQNYYVQSDGQTHLQTVTRAPMEQKYYVQCYDPANRTMQGILKLNPIPETVQELEEAGGGAFIILGQPLEDTMMSECYFPQNRTAGFLHDFSNWSIVDTQEMQGRTCSVIEGKTAADYGRGMGIDTYRIYVDNETGIWLQFEGFGFDGEVQEAIYTSDIRFGADAKPVSSAETADLTGYTDLSEEFGYAVEKTAAMTQDTLYYRCRTSIQFLDRISGSVELYTREQNSGDFHITGSRTEGNFSLDFEQENYFGEYSCYDKDGESTYHVQMFNDNGHFLARYMNNQYELLPESSPDAKYFRYYVKQYDPKNNTMHGRYDENPIPETWQALDTSVDDGVQIFAHPLDETMLSQCYFPQERTAGFLHDFNNWSIVDTQEMQGRTCSVVEGKTAADYGRGMGIDTYRIYVDNETGIWLQFEGFGFDGEVQEAIYTSDIRFGADAKPVSSASEVDLTGWNDLSAKFGYFDYDASLEEMQQALRECGDQP